MMTPIIFVAKTADKQLNNTLETMAVNLNSLGRLAFEYVNIRSPGGTSSTTTPWTQPIPTVGTPYETSTSITVATNGRLLLISASIEAQLDYTTAGTSSPELVATILYKPVSSVSYNPADVLATVGAYSAATTGSQTWKTTITIPTIVTQLPTDSYNFAVFLKYLDNGTAITASSLSTMRSSLTIQETR